MSIEVGQVYASTHSGDVASGQRQRRRVIAVDMAACKVQLQTEPETATTVGKPSTVMLRSPKSRTIPGHRLVEDALAIVPCPNCEMVAASVFPPGSYRGDPDCPACEGRHLLPARPC